MTERLAPVGQIRVLGELREARSTRTVPTGTSVRVVAVRGLVGLTSSLSRKTPEETNSSKR